MQLKMQDIIGFSTFYDAVKNQKLSMKTAYRLAQLARAADGEIVFYREKFQEIVRRYGELDEHGNPIPTAKGDGVKLRPGTEQDCYQAMAELQNLEVEMPDITFTIDDFSNVELTTTEIHAIMPFIVE